MNRTLLATFSLLLFVATLSLNALAIPDDGNRKPNPAAQMLELKVNGPASNLTDEMISNLLLLINPTELANAQYALQMYGVSIANCSSGHCSEKIASALKKAKQIYSVHAKSYLLDKRDPSYTVPIVAIDGKKYMFANQDSFGRGDFNVIISERAFNYFVQPERRVSNNPYVVVPATAISDVFMILQDICRTGTSNRRHPLSPVGDLHRFSPKNMSVDLSIFDQLKACP